MSNRNDKASVEKRIARIRAVDIVLGVILIAIQIFTMVSSKELSYEAGHYLYGIFGVVLLLLGFFMKPKE